VNATPYDIAAGRLPPRQAAASLQDVLWDEESQFARCYNRSSFAFNHGLWGHPLLDLHGLVALSKRRPDDAEHAYWSHGSVAMSDRWEKGRTPRHDLTETIANIATNDSLVMLRHVERDPLLGPLMQSLLSRVVQLSGPEMREDVITGRATILIASPGRITAYHIDADCNHLLQVAGDKLISVFDHTDRSLTPHEELEDYYCGDFNGARPKQHRENEAKVYRLRPGRGVHIPCTAPHWAKNGDNVSIAVSLNFDLRSGERLAQLYQLNRHLRQLGIHPRPPGESAWRDRLKLASSSGMTAVRGLLRPRPSASRQSG
jgi:hypothetical protein